MTNNIPTTSFPTMFPITLTSLEQPVAAKCADLLRLNGMPVTAIGHNEALAQGYAQLTITMQVPAHFDLELNEDATHEDRAYCAVRHAARYAAALDRITIGHGLTLHSIALSSKDVTPAVLPPILKPYTVQFNRDLVLRRTVREEGRTTQELEVTVLAESEDHANTLAVHLAEELLSHHEDNWVENLDMSDVEWETIEGRGGIEDPEVYRRDSWDISSPEEEEFNAQSHADLLHKQDDDRLVAQTNAGENVLPRNAEGGWHNDDDVRAVIDQLCVRLDELFSTEAN